MAVTVSTSVLRRHVATNQATAPPYPPILISNCPAAIIVRHQSDGDRPLTDRPCVSSVALLAGYFPVPYGPREGRIAHSGRDGRDGGKKKTARLPALEFIDSFLQHVLPRGKRHVRNYGYLAPGKRVASLQLLAMLFDLNATEEDAEEEKGDEPSPEKDERPERICPCCEVGVMVSVQKFPRPSVHQIMQMSLDQLRQPTLPFM